MPNHMRPSIVYSHCLYLFLAVPMLAGGAGPESQITETETKENYRGKEYPIGFSMSGENAEKFLILEDGKKLDLREYYQAKELDRVQRYGKITPLLLDSLSLASDTDSFPVHVEFAVRTPDPQGRDRRISKEQAMVAKADAFQRGSQSLIAALNLDPSGLPSFQKHPRIFTRMSKRQILKLKHHPDLAFITSSSKIDPKHAMVNMSNVFTWASGGMAFPDKTSPSTTSICGNYCGQAALPVAAWDLYNIYGPARPRVEGPWLTIRNASSSHNEEHGSLVLSMIRNAVGTSISNFQYGGSRDLPSLIYTFPPNDVEIDPNPAESLEWAIEQGANIVSMTWFFPRWQTQALPIVWQNKIEWSQDYYAANSPYVLSVVSAGNGGEINNARNTECQNAGDWTAEECQRVPNFNYNAIYVGSVNHATQRSPFSSWRNFHRDEKPHLMARGNDVQFPWGETSSGTSFTAPAVVSLAANLQGLARSTGRTLFPEEFKVILMASAQRVGGATVPRWNNYLNAYPELLSGAGVPKAHIAMKLVNNGCEGTADGGIYGFCSGNFSASDPNGADRTHSVTITGPAQTIGFWLSWVSSPKSSDYGSLYNGDDVDIYISRPGASAGSALVNNSTEYAYIAHPGGTVTYTVRVALYQRHSDPEKPIWYSFSRVPYGDSP